VIKPPEKEEKRTQHSRGVREEEQRQERRVATETEQKQSDNIKKEKRRALNLKNPDAGAEPAWSHAPTLVRFA